MNDQFSYFKVESTSDPKMDSVVFYDRDGAQVAVERHSTADLSNPVFYDQLSARLNPAALPRPDIVRVGPLITFFDCWVFYYHGERQITRHRCHTNDLTLQSIVAFEINYENRDVPNVDYEWRRDNLDQIQFVVYKKSWWVRAVEWLLWP